jgi:hypothetical protein
MVGVTLPGAASAQTLFDHYLPAPIVGGLTSNCWGASNVLPRDQDNGLEDRTNESWSYWNGRFLRAPDGKYHLFASRWDEAAGHWGGWPGSDCVHAVSDSSPLGPFVDQGLCYSDAGGQGHNVMASQLPDGRYFILVSETRRPAVIYTSNSLDGPWQLEGTITTDANGYPVDASPGGNLHSNTTLWVRPDGSILGTARDGVIMLSTSGILGPYLVQGTSVHANIPYTPGGTPEDPALWYSGGQYHMVYGCGWRNRLLGRQRSSYTERCFFRRRRLRLPRCWRAIGRESTRRLWRARPASPSLVQATTDGASGHPDGRATLTFTAYPRNSSRSWPRVTQ